LNGTGIQVLAHTGVTTSLPIVAAMPGHHGHALGGTDKYTSLFRHGSKPIAIADVPVGEYVHDLLAAYPNSCVFLSLMPVRIFCIDVGTSICRCCIAKLPVCHDRRMNG
jgi:hypothetical protein